MKDGVFGERSTQMQVVTDPAQLRSWRNCWVSIGNFDGVHRGHRAMLSRLTERAAEHRARSLVFTFDPSPLAVLHPPAAPPALTTRERKLELLATTGVDGVLVYPTDAALLSLTDAEFFQQMLIEQLDVAGLIEGPNFFFGRGRTGSIQTLAEYCVRMQRGLEIVPPLAWQDRMVSSTEIRGRLLDGEVAEANELLDSRYRLTGIVGSGAKRGRTIGFPTANLEQVATVVPAPGVYAGRALAEGKWWTAAMNVGPNPTFQETRQKLEVHLLGYSGDLYGQPVSFEFWNRLRDIHKFAGLEELIAQLNRDLAATRELVESGAAR